MLGSLTVVLLLATSLRAQATQFEVASVKPSAGSRPQGAVSPGRVEYINAPLAGLIRIAYGIEPEQLVCPGWMRTTFFDIVGKPPAGTTPAQRPALLRALLENRFRLKLHHEMRAANVYVLSVAKGGPKLKNAAQDSTGSATPQPAGPGERMSLMVWVMEDGTRQVVSLFKRDRAIFEGDRVTMPHLVRSLRSYTDAPIVDETGLSGAYEIVLEVPKRPTHGESIPQETGQALVPDVSIYSSIQTLGLRLEKNRRSLEYIIVESAEKTPVEN